MKLTKETVKELGVILKEEFDLNLNQNDLEKLAYCLIGYFGLLFNMEKRSKFGDSPDSLIEDKM